MLNVTVYTREDGSIASGFVIPSINENGGEVVIASSCVDGKYGGPFETVHSGNMRASIHLSSEKIHPWICIDAQTKDVKVLCARD